MKLNFKRYLVTGALILVPLILTSYCFLLLLGLANNSLSIPIGRFLFSSLHAFSGGAWGSASAEVPAFWASLIGTVLILLSTYAVGLAGSSLFGRQIFAATEGLIEQIPVFKTVYTTMKQVVTEFSPAERRSFRKVVLVASADGKHNLGFLTGQTHLDVPGGSADVRSVYLPTNHLWFGEVRIVPARDIVETDLTVEQGISFILSCGAAVPPQITKKG